MGRTGQGVGDSWWSWDSIGILYVKLFGSLYDMIISISYIIILYYAFICTLYVRHLHIVEAHSGGWTKCLETNGWIVCHPQIIPPALSASSNSTSSELPGPASAINSDQRDHDVKPRVFPGLCQFFLACLGLLFNRLKRVNDGKCTSLKITHFSKLLFPWQGLPMGHFSVGNLNSSSPYVAGSSHGSMSSSWRGHSSAFSRSW